MANEIKVFENNGLVNYNGEYSDRPTVSGRELHKALEISTEYKKWFGRMCEYGFTDGEDYVKVTQKCLTSSTGQKITNHQLTLDMAKELCMIQRTELGRKFRQHFIEIEKAWNTPEMIMARALQISNSRNKELESKVTELNEEIEELTPKANYCDLVLSCPDLMPVTTIAQDYGMTTIKFNQKLHELGIQYRQGSMWRLYSKYLDKNYADIDTYYCKDKYGGNHAYQTMKWTQKGRLFLYEKLKEEGILPEMERHTVYM